MKGDLFDSAFSLIVQVPAMDQILATDIEVMCRIGCTEEERAYPQRLMVSVRAGVDTCPAAETLDLDRSVCYATLCELTRSLAASRSWTLVEEYAQSLTRSFFERFPAMISVTVLIRKFALPGVAWTGIEIHRSR